jgi:hypothetical protein
VQSSTTKYGRDPLFIIILLPLAVFVSRGSRTKKYVLVFSGICNGAAPFITACVPNMKILDLLSSPLHNSTSDEPRPFLWTVVLSPHHRPSSRDVPLRAPHTYTHSVHPTMASKATDMSVKVGGRVFQPALPVVDGAPSSPLELAFHRTLEAYTSENIPLETKAGMETRERVLNQMRQVCRDWIRFECTSKGLPADVVEAAGGQLFTSGSYRLNVAEPGADIDCVRSILLGDAYYIVLAKSWRPCRKQHFTDSSLSLSLFRRSWWRLVSCTARTFLARRMLPKKIRHEIRSRWQNVSVAIQM